MAKTIGPNFANELAAAEINGDGISWDTAGYMIRADMADAKEGPVAAVYAAHDPARPDPKVEATKLLTTGLAITSSGDPTINGTYGTAQADEIVITGLQVAVKASVFPGFFRDIAGKRHAMTAEQFIAIATALLGFIVNVDEAKEAALAGETWVAPSTQTRIG